MTPYLADPGGRRVLLHGAAAVGLQDTTYPGAGNGPAIYPVDTAAYDGRCPTASPLAPQPPLCEVQAARPEFAQSVAPGSGDDFAQMRAFGFDVVRLVLNWSQLEPTPGQYSQDYLDRVDQVVGWAGQQGIYVILDMHQDQYSRFIEPASTQAAAGCSPSGGQDGAPAWAVVTDGKPGCAVLGQSSLNEASAAAFSNFWADKAVPGPRGQAPGPGLEDHYIGALAALAARFEGDSTVLGYELMNEPEPGSTGSLPFSNLYQASSENLYPFYTKAIEALTGVRDAMATCPSSDPMTVGCAYPALTHVTDQQIFFEPIAYRNLVDFSPQVSVPFTSYPNIVFAPHVYTHTFTLDTEVMGYTPQNSPYPPSYDFGYQTAEAEAQAMHAAVFVTEFGAAADTDATILSSELQAQDDTLTGGTLWAWKGLGTQIEQCWCVRFQKDDYASTTDGLAGTGDPRVPPSADVAIPSRQRDLARVWPEDTAGALLAFRFEPTKRTFAMLGRSARIHRGDRGAETVVFIAAGVDGRVAVSGAAVLDAVVTRPDGSRLAFIAPRGAPRSPSTPATYTVTVGTVPPAELSAVLAEAAHPLPPIPEVQARALLDAAIARAEASSVPAVRAGGDLAAQLEPLLLGPSSQDPNLTTAG